MLQSPSAIAQQFRWVVPNVLIQTLQNVTVVKILVLGKKLKVDYLANFTKYSVNK